MYNLVPRFSLLPFPFKRRTGFAYFIQERHDHPRPGSLASGEERKRDFENEVVVCTASLFDLEQTADYLLLKVEGLPGVLGNKGI